MKYINYNLARIESSPTIYLNNVSLEKESYQLKKAQKKTIKSKTLQNRIPFNWEKLLNIIEITLLVAVLVGILALSLF